MSDKWKIPPMKVEELDEYLQDIEDDIAYQEVFKVKPKLNEEERSRKVKHRIKKVREDEED